MLNRLRKEVCEANKRLFKEGLVSLTWGNVSAFDSSKQLIIIKPSGVDYKQITPKDMVVVDLKGNIVKGKLNPSCDTPIHIELYKRFPQITSITHTHSTYATAFAQAGLDIPVLGTTHSDYVNGPILCTRQISDEETQKNYESNTAKVITETILSSPNYINESIGILLRSHGVFSWGSNPNTSVDNAAVIEQIAKMAYLTKNLKKDVKVLPIYLLKKHHNRKNGVTAYYGQKKQP